MKNKSRVSYHVFELLFCIRKQPEKYGTNLLYYIRLFICINNQLLDLQLFIVGFIMVHACQHYCNMHVTSTLILHAYTMHNTINVTCMSYKH